MIWGIDNWVTEIENYVRNGNEKDGLKKMENMMLGGKRTWIWQQNWNDLMRFNAGKKDIFKEKNEVFPLEHINWKCHIFYLHPVLSLEGGLW